jgi:hypothetical protein
MQALILTGDSGLASVLADVATEAGFHCIRYTDPLRALDNALELSPDILLIDALKFPRHCQLAEGMLASLPSSRRFPILRVFSRPPSSKPGTETASKYSVHEGDGDGLSFNFDGNPATAQNLFGYLASMASKGGSDGVASMRFMKGSKDAPGLVILHPRRLIPMSFSVRRISASGLQAVPDNSELARELVQGEILMECAMSLGERSFAFGSILEGAGPSLTLVFDSMSTEDRCEILSYIDISVRNNPFHQLMKE